MSTRQKFELVTYDFIEVLGIKLFRIRALIAFNFVSEGDLGGYVEKTENVDQSGNAWVSGDARVYGNAQVCGNASIFWASRVGSEQGTLTVFRTESGLGVTRGCFNGTDSEFLRAVDSEHGAHSKIGREYHLLIEVARSRIGASQPTPESEKNDKDSV